MAEKKPKKGHVVGHAVVESFAVEGVTYQLRFVACGKDRCRKGCAGGKPSHGPYWYAILHDTKRNKTRTVYKGKRLPPLETLANQPEHDR